MNVMTPSLSGAPLTVTLPRTAARFAPLPQPDAPSRRPMRKTEPTIRVPRVIVNTFHMP
jgi:hypothetical protein